MTLNETLRTLKLRFKSFCNQNPGLFMYIILNDNSCFDFFLGYFLRDLLDRDLDRESFEWPFSPLFLRFFVRHFF